MIERRHAILFALIFLAGCAPETKDAFRLGLEQFDEGRHTEAVENFTKAIRKNPGNANAYFFRGASYSALERQAEAVHDYTKTLEIDPGHPHVHWSRGYVYAQQGNYTEALNDLTTSLERGPKDKALVHSLRAKVFFRLSELDKAEEDLRAVLQIRPQDRGALQGLEEIRKARANPGFNPNDIASRTNSPNTAEGSQRLKNRRPMTNLFRQPSRRPEAARPGNGKPEHEPLAHFGDPTLG